MESLIARQVKLVLTRLHLQTRRRTGTLDALMKLEEALGYVPLDSLPQIAHSLEVTEAEVAGVLSYYPNLHRQARGRHVVRVCHGEACLANHGNRVLQKTCKQLQVAAGETTPDGRYTIEKVYCVGNCGVSPTVVIDGDLYGRVSADQVTALLERYR